MSKAFDSLIDGLNEALDFAQGKETGAVAHRIEVPDVDVAAIRAQTGLSQRSSRRASAWRKGPC